jgi:hypothetical protein
MLLTHLFETAKKSTVDPRDLMLEQANPEDYDDYEDEDEDLRLRSGDYVRDQQDGESGEIFRMQGDPSERRVQILDRDGRGWYIAPDRLTRVDPQDPDVQRYFGKQRVRDMDESGMAESAKPGEYYIHTVYFKDGTKKRVRVTSDEFDVVGYYTKRGQAVDRVDYDFQIHSNMTEGSTNGDLDENLRDWFGKEKWVRMDTKGNIKGDCARGSKSEGKPKCLPQAKAHALGKKGRAAAAQKKRRQDPNPERRGAAINVATKVKESRGGNYDQMGYRKSNTDRYALLDRTLDAVIMTGNNLSKLKQEAVEWAEYDDIVTQVMDQATGKQIFAVNGYEEAMNYLDEACWKGYHKDGMKTMFGKRYPNCVKNKNESLEVYVNRGECPGCGGAMVSEDQITEKQDACYHKVKSRYKVWPSAYASGALVQCRKKGASNWGNGGKNEDVSEAKNLNKRVRVVKTGETGTIRQIKSGAFKGAPKTYYVDLDNGGQADNLPATALRLIKTQEGRREVDEVSKDTLGRYIKLAGIDAADRASSSSYRSGAAGDKYNKADPSRQEISRERGIDRAIKKITK